MKRSFFRLLDSLSTRQSALSWASVDRRSYMRNLGVRHLPGLKVRGRFDRVRDWMESCEWFLAVGTDLLACRYGIPGFPISPARHWPSHPVTSSPGPNPPEIPPLGTKDSPCSAIAQTQHAHNGRVCRADLRPTCPTRYQVNSYNESIICRLVLPGTPEHLP